MNLLELLPQRLREKRKACDLTLAQAGERVGLSVSFLSDIEVGRANPSLDTLVRLAGCYHTSVAELFIEAEVHQYVYHIRRHMLEKMLEEIREEMERMSL